MSRDREVEQYLEEARKAEEMAAQVSDETIREAWLKIAEDYRRLAKKWRGF